MVIDSGKDGLPSGKRPLKPLLTTTATKDREPGERGSGGKEVNMAETEEEDAGETVEGEEEPMSPAGRLFRQRRFNCFIVAAMGSGRRIDVDVLKTGLEATLLRHPRFSSVQVDGRGGGGKPRWVRVRVAPENHLVVVDPDPDSVDSPDRFVEDYAAGLSRTPLDDLSKPRWDLHILNLRTSDAEATAVFRIHHSLGDGISLISLLLACTRKASDPDALPSIPGGGGGGGWLKPRVAAGNARGRWARVVAFLLGLCALLRVAWNTVVDVLLFVATAAFLEDTETPLKGKEGVEFNPKRFVRRTLSLEDMKAVKNAMGATINDVLLGVTSAGLTRYLSRRYEGEGSNGKKNLPKNIRMRSTVLVNIRPSPGIPALADMMAKGNKHKASWGNWLGYVLVPFPIVKREDPLEYIRVAREIAERKKRSLEAISTYSCAHLIVKVFGIKVAAALTHRVLSHTTLSFSNVVGPSEEIAFYGHPVTYVAPSVHGHPQALTVHFQSYMNKMELVVAVDETAIPDPHQLCEDVAASLKRIKDALVPTSPSTSHSLQEGVVEPDTSPAR